MAGESLTGSRLSAITGTSAATTADGLGARAFIMAGLACKALACAGGAAADLGGGDFAGAALPPLMARNTGLPLGTFLPNFALAALPAVLTDLLALAISLAPLCPRPGAQDYKVMRRRDTTARHC